MPVYTVHEPPVRTPGALADPARFIFVRDGFYWWAFLLTPLWMLWRRLWLVSGVLYLLISIGVEAAMRVYGASSALIVPGRRPDRVSCWPRGKFVAAIYLEAARLEECRRRFRQRSSRRGTSVFRRLGRNGASQPTLPPAAAAFDHATPLTTSDSITWLRIGLAEDADAARSLCLRRDRPVSRARSTAVSCRHRRLQFRQFAFGRKGRSSVRRMRPVSISRSR